MKNNPYDQALRLQDEQYILRCGPGMTLKGYWASLALDLLAEGHTIQASIDLKD